MSDNVLGNMPQYDDQGNVVPLDDSVLDECTFGSRVADQMDAMIEVDRKEEARSRIVSTEQPRRSTGRFNYHEKLDGMDHDARVTATLECLDRRGSFRDILYGLLGFCMDERSYEEIESFVEGFVEFCTNRQEPRRYVFMLLRCGALAEIELGEDGAPLTGEEKQAAIEEGLDPEDVDTLVYDWRVVTTDVGREAYETFSPSMRIQQLAEEFPDRIEAFVRIMEFCREPKDMGAINERFKGKPLLGIDEGTSLKRQPSSYIQKLDAAGAVNWTGNAWMLTDAGEVYLNSRASG